MSNMKKDQPPTPSIPAFHIPIEPAGSNAAGTIHFSQGLLPFSSWLVVPSSPTQTPQIPVPQIQVMNSGDYVKIIETAWADLHVNTQLKMISSNNKKFSESSVARDYMAMVRDQIETNRTYAMLNAPGNPSPNPSLAIDTPLSMSPRTSNDR